MDSENRLKDKPLTLSLQTHLWIGIYWVQASKIKLLAECFCIVEGFMIKIIADENIPALDETFGRHGKLQRIDGRNVCRPDLSHADVLLVRSVTRVNADLLRGTNIRFVGSTTIGIDHLDTAWLEANNIAWAHAPGCNADAAAQYTLAMMWLACKRLQKNFRQQTVGIIGRGNVGQRLEHLLQVLDIPVMACDPPLQDLGEANLVSMHEACANNIISLHVPLTHTGKYPSKNLFGPEQLAKLNLGTLLVNAARGGVIEATALQAQLKSGRLHAALDVWPDEPFIAPELLAAVAVATPHVAGYSYEGKQAGTEMIYQAFCSAFACPRGAQPTIKTQVVTTDLSPTTSADEGVLSLLQSSCPVARDDASLRALCYLSHNGGLIQFDGLRTSYPQRHEFRSYLVTGATGTTASRLNRMGFQTD